MTRSSKEITVSKDTERMPTAVLFSDMERMFEDLFNGRWLQPFGWQRPFGAIASVPHVDVIDRDDEVVVRAEVPGYKKEDIEISVSDSSLTIRGETRTEDKGEKGDYYYCCEISHGAFSRSLALPAEVDDSKAKASMKDGLLELTLPKLEKAKRHAISIA